MNKNNTDLSNHPEIDIQIDLLKVAKKIIDGKRIIARYVLIFLIYGLLYAYFYPNEYTATTKILPEFSSQNNLSRFGGLAAQFGLNIGGSPM